VFDPFNDHGYKDSLVSSRAKNKKTIPTNSHLPEETNPLRQI
ncbi:20492_t:CDS:1, partial [Gigaspora margarita]